MPRTEMYGDHDCCVWTCKNRECGTTYSEKPETWKCQAEGCEVECCNEIGCRQVCSICDQVFCHSHSMVLDAGILCVDCFLWDFEDQELGTERMRQ